MTSELEPTFPHLPLPTDLFAAEEVDAQVDIYQTEDEYQVFSRTHCLVPPMSYNRSRFVVAQYVPIFPLVTT